MYNLNAYVVLVTHYEVDFDPSAMNSKEGDLSVCMYFCKIKWSLLSLHIETQVRPQTDKRTE